MNPSIPKPFQTAFTRLIFPGIFLMIVLFPVPAVQASDLALTNAKVYTVNPAQPWAEAAVVKGNKLVYVGDSAGIGPHLTDATRVIDLNGKMVLPGFIDSHFHAALAALFASGIPLMNGHSDEYYRKAIADWVNQNPEAPVVFGFGFDPFIYGADGPDKHMLDAIVADRPVYLLSIFGHSAWANSKALELLGVNRDTEDPLPGVYYYQRDRDGNPTGFLVELGAVYPHLNRLGITTKSLMKEAYRKFLAQLPETGITSLFDAGALGIEEVAFQALVELEAEGDLPVRYSGSRAIIFRYEGLTAADDLIRFKELYKTNLVRPAKIKIYLDAVAQSEETLFAEQELTEILTAISGAEQDVFIHAINSKAIHDALNAIERTRNIIPRSKSRFTITHNVHISAADIGRYALLDVSADMQPFFILDPLLFPGFNSSMAPEDQLVLRSLWNTGAVVSLSSDFPACIGPLSTCTPLNGMEIGHTRRLVGKPDSTLVPPKSESLSVSQLIQGYTLNGAYQIRMEDKLGSLEPGKLADLVVLEKNPFEVKAHELHSIKVLMTIMDGRVVYNAIE